MEAVDAGFRIEITALSPVMRPWTGVEPKDESENASSQVLAPQAG